MAQEIGKLYRVKKQVQGVVPSAQNSEYYELINLGGGGSTKPSQLIFEQQEPKIPFVYDVDFPRYKLQNIIPENIPLIDGLDFANEISFKKDPDDGYYYLSFRLNSFTLFSNKNNVGDLPNMEEDGSIPVLGITSTNGTPDIVKQTSYFSLFFPINEYISLEKNEYETDVPDYFTDIKFSTYTDFNFSFLFYVLIKFTINQQLSKSTEPTYIKFKIKERRRLSLDTYFCSLFRYYDTDYNTVRPVLDLKLINTDENKVKFKGSYTINNELNGLGKTLITFYTHSINNIVNNYFDDNDSIENCGNTSTGKHLKLVGITIIDEMENTILEFSHTDDTPFEANEVLNIEFSPKKGNEVLDNKIKDNIENVEDVRLYILNLEKRLKKLEQK